MKYRWLNALYKRIPVLLHAKSIFSNELAGFARQISCFASEDPADVHKHTSHFPNKTDLFHFRTIRIIWLDKVQRLEMIVV